jgi:formyltetrahydrofolate deformylase
LKPIAETFGIPFKHFPITPQNKLDQEEKEIQLLKHELEVDVVVLARYMQVLSNQFLGAFSHDQIINIHHSFLPAFIGRSPYHQVRIILRFFVCPV